MPPESTLPNLIKSFLIEAQKSYPHVSNSGIAVSVVSKDRLIYQDCFGLRDQERQLPATNKTLFSLYSLTKSFSVLPFLKAHTDKNWDLDDPMTKVFPTIDFKDRELHEKISSVDLMSHRAGLPSNDLIWILTSLTAKETVERFTSFEKVDSFRTSFNYCNLGYTYLDLAYQHRFGTSTRDYVEKNLLPRLEMKNTLFLNSPDGQRHEIAKPYTNSHPIKWMNTQNIIPAGGLVGNIEDMGRWMQFHLDAMTQAPNKLGISKDSIVQMYQPHVGINQQSPIFFQGFEWLKTNLSYGLGWFMGEWNGEKVYFHPGIGDGFSTAILILPESDIGICVLSNSTLSPLPGQITSLILKAQFNKDVVLTTRPPPSLPLPEVPKSFSEAKTNHLQAGIFHNPIFGDFELQKQGSLWKLVFNNLQLPINFLDRDNAFVMLPAFGVHLPMSLKFTSNSTFEMPLSMDPRVEPQKFTRKL